MRKSLVASADQAVYGATHLVLQVLLARWLSTADYGRFAATYAGCVLVQLVHNAAYVEPTVVFSAKKAGDARDYLRRAVATGTVQGTALAILLTIASAVLSRILAGPSGFDYAYLVGAVSLLLMPFWFARRVLWVLDSGVMAFAGTITYALIACVGLLLLSFAGHLSATTGLLVIGGTGAVVGLAFLAGAGVLAVSPTLSRSELRSLWQYGRWSSPATIINWLSGHGYFVLFPLVASVVDGAHFRALLNLVLPVQNVLIGLSAYWLPRLSADVSQHGFDGIASQWRRMLLLMGAITLAYVLPLIAFGDRIVELLYAGAYQEIAGHLPLAALAMLAWPLMYASTVGLRAVARPARVFTVNIVIVAGVGSWAAPWALIVGGSYPILSYSVIQFLLACGLFVAFLMVEREHRLDARARMNRSLASTSDQDQTSGGNV